MEEGGSKEDAEKAAEDVKITEKWLKKLKKAEIDYKNRDRSIGKRISKGLFEGKDEIKVDTKEKEKTFPSESVSGVPPPSSPLHAKDNSDGVCGSPCVQDAAEDMTSNSTGSSSGADGPSSHVSAEELSASPSKSPRKESLHADIDTNNETNNQSPSRRAGIHPVVEHVYTYQLYYYSAVFIASVAVGLQVL